jgi:hypothetical protein
MAAQSVHHCDEIAVPDNDDACERAAAALVGAGFRLAEGGSNRPEI